MRSTSRFLLVALWIFVVSADFGARVGAAPASRGGATKALTPREIFRKTAGLWSGEIFLLPRRYNTLIEAGELDPGDWYPSRVKGRWIPPHPIAMHGVAWDYDLRIPLVFWDPKGQWTRNGQHQNLAYQQDIAPTLAAILGVPAPARNGGRVLREALARTAESNRPKVIIGFVQDQVGTWYLKAHPGKAPFYESLLRNGASFQNATVAHVDVETSVGHAAIGTGAWPSEHGIAGNYLQHPGIFRALPAQIIQTSEAQSSRRFNALLYFTPTISDMWSMVTNGAGKILSVAPAARAAISMGGHGSLFSGGIKTAVVWSDTPGANGEWGTESGNYFLPEAFKGQNIAPWINKLAAAQADVGGKSWMGHPLYKADGQIDPYFAQATPAAATQQGELTLKAIEEMAIGRDDVPDLVWINMKSTDYCGHLFGYESDECADVLSAVDAQAKAITESLAKAAGDRLMVVLTADHGAAPLQELTGGTRLSRAKLKSDLNSRFDKRDNRVDAIAAVTSSQVYVNRAELSANGHSLKDVVRFLRNYEAELSPANNALASEWIAKGVPVRRKFFEDVVSVDELRPSRE